MKKAPHVEVDRRDFETAWQRYTVIIDRLVHRRETKVEEIQTDRSIDRRTDKDARKKQTNPLSLLMRRLRMIDFLRIDALRREMFFFPG